MNGKETILVALNPSAAAAKADFDMGATFSKWTLLAGRKLKMSASRHAISLTVPGQSYAIYKIR